MPQALLLENIHPFAAESLRKHGFDVVTLKGALNEDELIDALDGVADTPNGLENWYAARLLDDDFRTPAQVAEETRSVTVEQLQECAGRLSLDTVYRLVAEKEEVQAQ